MAVQQGKIELVKELIARGADVKTLARRGWAAARGMTPFLEGSRDGNVALMKRFDQVRRRPEGEGEAVDGSGAVFLAAGSKKLEAVKLLVETGLDVNETPRGRGGALHTAVKAGSNDIVQYLADHGADFSAKDNFGRTPLEEALFEAPKPTIELDAEAHGRAGRSSRAVV